MSMTTNHTELIKDKLSILDVVSSYVTLEKAGKTWKGKSPFTNEKTPSFFVSPEKGFFYCFSSGKGGDIFNFIQEIERVDFKDALKILADKAGVDLGSQESSSINTVLYKILDDATRWYEVNLRKNKKAVDYLLDRGLTKDTIVNFRIGFAKDSWSDVYDYLKKKGYTDHDIELCGLTVKKDKGGYYDRFRSRIMFPIMDSRGRVAGFSGRIFSDNPDEKGAKYVNSPEGPLFDKSKLLYGYHTAKSEISKKQQCILVEGQFDVLMAQQAGSVNTVAVSGTGLTDEHITLIKRFADTIVLSFDSDNAGIKATKRSVLKAYEHGLKVKVITLPLGQDPADTIKSSVAKWEVAVADAQDYIDYRLELFEKQHPQASFEEKYALVTNEIFSFIYLLKSSVLQDRVLQNISLFLGVTVESVRSDFNVFVPTEDVQEVQKQKNVSLAENSKGPLVEGKEEIVNLSLYLAHTYPDQWQKEEQIHTYIEEVYGKPVTEIHRELSEEISSMILFKQEALCEGIDVSKLLANLKIMVADELVRHLHSQSSEILKHIRQVEHQQDHTRLLELQQRNLELRKRIDTINNDNKHIV